ncbi:MFS transporter [Amycolatopsis pigmentata]|uniref:MFS transporter n=1 Tax=Amycolatopsis pigmentata TaxID=450801 RepID=A0ABW5FMW9_9PSEU
MKEESFEVRLGPGRMTVVTAVILFALLSYSLTSNMLTPLLPGLEKAYDVGSTTAIWIVLVTLLAGAVFVPSLCRLGDVFDAKKGMVLLGLGALVAGGVLAAAAPGLPLLFVGRALQGIGLLVFPMAAGVVNDEFPVLRRKLAMGMMSAALFVGIGTGGVLAALLVARSDGFRLVFWMSAALPFVALPFVVAFLPRGRYSTGRPGQWWREIDLPGALGFAVPAIALVIAFSKGADWGWSSPAVVILFVVAAATFAAWVVVERRVAKPLVDMKVFFSRPLWVNNSVAMLGGFGLVGGAVATSTFVQLPPVAGVHGFGLSAVQGALIILPAESMTLFVGPVVGYLSRRAGKGLFLTGGAVVQMLGFVLLLTAHSSTAAIVVAMVVVGLGSGSVASSFGLIYVEDVPPEHVGRLFGISPILANGVGGSLAGAVFAAVLTSHGVPGTRLPSERGFETFWLIAGAVLLVGAAIASVYLVTYWAGFRGGDRAMARRERVLPTEAANVPAATADQAG